MEFFKKLFGFSTEEETSNYNKNEHEDNTPQVKVETKSEKPTSKQPNNPNMTSWENFFGLNLKTSPNKDWEVRGTDYSGDNIIRTYENYNLNNTYFSYVKALVIDSNATNFFFKCPYSWDDAFDIYFLIERDLVHHGNYTNTAAASKFRGNFDSYYDSFDWEIDGCNIRMSRDTDTGDIELGIWTLFYNEEYLGKTEKLPKEDTVAKEDVDFSVDTFDNEKTCWENFFGVNLKESPNASWKETQGDFANNKKIRNFICDEIDSDYFSYVKAKVIGDSATNFFFKRSYNWDDAFDIYYLIERDMVHGGKYANTDAADKFRGNFDSYYDHFDWEIDGCHITLSRDIDNGDIELSVWTLFYNKEYLDNMEETTVPATPVEEEVEEPSLPQRTFHVHFPDSIETLQFAREYMKAVVSGNTPIHIARADGNTIQILEEDSFEELYSFRNSEIASYLSGRLSAVSFAKFNCDDITDIQADAIVVVAGPSNEEDKKEPDALIHYEMDYLVDPIEIDYRRKTIMDGTMNLNLVGIQYRDNYEELMETLEEGMKVVLKPEPTNEFDPNALAFYYNDEVIGYLPKKDQPFAHIFMAKGQIEATICNIDEQWIDTEVVISKDMIDFDAYESNGVRFTKIESC